MINCQSMSGLMSSRELLEFRELATSYLRRSPCDLRASVLNPGVDKPLQRLEALASQIHAYSKAALLEGDIGGEVQDAEGMPVGYRGEVLVRKQPVPFIRTTKPIEVDSQDQIDPSFMQFIDSFEPRPGMEGVLEELKELSETVLELIEQENAARKAYVAALDTTYVALSDTRTSQDIEMPFKAASQEETFYFVDPLLSLIEGEYPSKPQAMLRDPAVSHEAALELFQAEESEVTIAKTLQGEETIYQAEMATLESSKVLVETGSFMIPVFATLALIVGIALLATGVGGVAGILLLALALALYMSLYDMKTKDQAVEQAMNGAKATIETRVDGAVRGAPSSDMAKFLSKEESTRREQVLTRLEQLETYYEGLKARALA